jgi:8-oxo-dGTP pyrophosphatase MutT (NUDIX family)
MGELWVKIRNEIQAVIFDKRNGRLVVLLVRKTDRRNRRQRWRLLKGGVDQGETRIEALKREIFEEIGLSDIQVLGEAYRYGFVFGETEHRVTSFLVKVNSEHPIRLQRSELAGYLWAYKDEATRLLHWRNEKEAVKSLDRFGGFTGLMGRNCT